MAEALRLRVLTPTGVAVEAEATTVVLPGHDGELGVLPGHTEYLSLTVSGVLSWEVPAGRRESVAVRRGLAEVRDDTVTVLTEEVLRPGDLESSQFEAREKDARRLLEEALDRGEASGELRDEAAFLGAARSIAG